MTDPIIRKEYLGEATSCYLPKWPQMLVYGDNIMPDQALEIIRRTDSFFQGGGGNDKEFEREACRIIGRPYSGWDADIATKDYAAHYDAIREWEKRWGVIHTEYVRNSWVSDAYIFGPTGWCHPNGSLSHSRNVGKDPGGEDLLDEWARLAAHFPFLNLQAVFMDGEESEDRDLEPMLIIDVAEGKARASSPSEVVPFQRFAVTLAEVQRGVGKPDMAMAAMSIAFGNPRQREHHFDLDQLYRWAKQVE